MILSTRTNLAAQRSYLSSLVLSLVPYLLASLLPSSTSAQAQTGTPPLGSFGGGSFDTVDFANADVHFQTSVFSRPGRGLPFYYLLVYDSLVWSPTSSSGSSAWTPASNWGWSTITDDSTGYVFYKIITNRCPYGSGPPFQYYYWNVYSGFWYVDSFGTPHPFAVTLSDWSSSAPCGSGPPSSGQGVATDGSGYTLSATGLASVAYGTVYSSSGTTFNAPFFAAGQAPSAVAGSLVDRNGNEISSSVSNGTTTFTDTQGTTVLTTSGSSPRTFTYTAPSGASASYTMSYVSYTVKTNFGCSGIAEYGPTSNSLVDRITLPDGSYYKFTYETTPGYSYVTGRLASVILPTGGQINYSYSGGMNGINCSDGSTATLTRQTPDGSWAYAHTPGISPFSTTTVTDPAGNQTVLQFAGIYETQRQAYQGNSSSGTLLETINTCYNGAASPCPNTYVGTPITQRKVATQFGSNGLQALQIFNYNNYGLLTEEDDYDYGSGGPGALLRKVLVTYASLGNITAFRQRVTVCNGNGSSSDCNGSGTVVSQTNYNYDETTVATSSGTPQHVAVSASRGNLTSINYPVSGLAAHFTYWDTGTPKTRQDVNGATTTYNYPDTTSTCGNAFFTSISEPLGMSRSMTWNCTGAVQLTSTDENSQTPTTTYSDPSFWRPAQESFPDGGQVSWTYNSQTSSTTTTKMNASQNIVSTVLLDGLGRTSQTQLGSDPQGVDYSVITYDALGRPYKVYNPTRCTPPTTNCGESTWGYTATVYDALNRVTKVTLQDGSATTVLYTNNTVTVTDPAGRKRQSTFDGLGRLTQVTEDPGGLGYVTTYGYDALSNLISVVQNGGRLRTFTYDGLSRLVCESNPEIQIATCPNPDNGSYTAGTIRYSYDNGGNLASRQAPAPNQTGSATVTTTYSWDVLHRLTQKSYSDGTTLAANYVYDQTANWFTLSNTKGRMTEAYTQGASLVGTIFSYDSMGRVTQNNQVAPVEAPSGGVPLTYTYDLAGNMTSYTNGSNTTFTQQIDAAARVTQLTSSLSDTQHPATLATVNSTVGFFPTGAIRSVHLGNSITETKMYNNRLQPCRINVNDSNTTLSTCTDSLPASNVEDFTYGYNAGSANNGNVASWSANGWLNFNRTNAYDALNRLSTMADSASSQPCKGLSWTYDAWGNRTDQTVTGGTCNSFHQTVNTQNRLVGPPYQYDAAGNMISDGSHTYTYDAENRPTAVDGGTTATYVYDALGRRVHRAGTGVALPTDYFYDLSGNVVAEFAPSCSGAECLTVGYIYLNGLQIAEYKNDTTYFHHKDHLGSTRLVSDVTAAYITDCFDFYPFGEPNVPTTPCSSGNSAPSHSNTTHEFTGDERDSETGLDHTWFRQYSSSLGRWMHPDPAGLAAVDPSNPQSWNRYSYVLNNPLNLIDPFGLVCLWDDGSYDAEDDPETGSAGGCQTAGGTWIDDTMGGNWSPDPNANLADLVAYLNSGQQGTLIQMDVWAPMLGEGPVDQSWGTVFAANFMQNMFSWDFYEQQLTDPHSCVAVFQEASAEPLHAAYHAAEAADQLGAGLIAASQGATSFANALQVMKNANPMFGGQLDPFLGPLVIAGSRGLASVAGRFGLAAEHAIPRALPAATVGAADASMAWGLVNEIYAAAKGKCH